MVVWKNNLQMTNKLWFLLVSMLEVLTSSISSFYEITEIASEQHADVIQSMFQRSQMILIRRNLGQ